MPAQRSLGAPLIVLVALLLAPAAASAGTALSAGPNLPSGVDASGSVTVGQTPLHGEITLTQLFTGLDTLATARLTMIRLAPNCGPGPSPGNPSTVGPAIDSPESPCSNPDLGVYANFSHTGTGAFDCDGIGFSITGPSATGTYDLTPSVPVDLTNGESCKIKFTFTVAKIPAKDTYPDRAGMQTSSIVAARSAVILNPGNPLGGNLQAAGMGSTDAVLVKPPPESHVSPELRFAGLHSGCVGRTLVIKLRGKGVTKVAFGLNGNNIGIDRKAPFQTTVPARRLHKGANNVTAKTVFRTGETKTVSTLHRHAFRCSAPNFTG